MIIKYKIKLDTIDKVAKFVNIISAFDNDVDIIQGRFVINGKSVMAIYSVDSTRPLTVVIHDASTKDVVKLEELMKEFKIDEDSI